MPRTASKASQRSITSKASLGPKGQRRRAHSPTTEARRQLALTGTKEDGTPFKSKYPMPRKQSIRQQRTKAWMDKFIRILRRGHNVTEACKAAGITRHWAYIVKGTDPGFAQRWEDAWNEGIDELEAEAHRRAMEGSDLLMIFMLKGNRGEKYRDRVIAENADGTPLSFTISIEKASDRGEEPEEGESPVDGQFRVVEDAETPASDS